MNHADEQDARSHVPIRMCNVRTRPSPVLASASAKIQMTVTRIARLVVPLLAPVALVAATGAQTANESGLRGYVLTHEDQPVSSGAVVLEATAPASTINATIDGSGYFRAVTTTSGLHHLSITVPGFATHRVDVIVPRSVNLRPAATVSRAT